MMSSMFGAAGDKKDADGAAPEPMMITDAGEKSAALVESLKASIQQLMDLCAEYVL